MATKKKGAHYISHGTIADNKKARFNYEIVETIEAGIQLQGTEVKSLRMGRCNIADSYAGNKNGRIFIFNLHINEWQTASNYFNHEPLRPRPLLLRKKEHNKLLGAVQKEGMSLIPLSLFFNHKGLAKIKLGLGKGKKLHDKRHTIKERLWQREQGRMLKKDYA